MDKWLENFAYRIPLNAWIFISSFLLAFIIAAFAISFQAIKAARANPIDSIRFE